MNTLLDIITGKSSLDDATSVREHLVRLLNTRRGSLVHLPTYGVPDIGEIYRGLPYSLNHLKNIIIYLIEHYEPRLKNVSIQHKAIHDCDTVLHLEISGMLKNNEKLFFNTYFVSGGQAIIREH
jgi:type VI secretion system protein